MNSNTEASRAASAGRTHRVTPQVLHRLLDLHRNLAVAVPMRLAFSTRSIRTRRAGTPATTSSGSTARYSTVPCAPWTPNASTRPPADSPGPPRARPATLRRSRHRRPRLGHQVRHRLGPLPAGQPPGHPRHHPLPRQHPRRRRESVHRPRRRPGRTQFRDPRVHRRRRLARHPPQPRPNHHRLRRHHPRPAAHRPPRRHRHRQPRIRRPTPALEPPPHRREALCGGHQLWAAAGTLLEQTITATAAATSSS